MDRSRPFSQEGLDWEISKDDPKVRRATNITWKGKRWMRRTDGTGERKSGEFWKLGLEI